MLKHEFGSVTNSVCTLGFKYIHYSLIQLTSGSAMAL